MECERASYDACADYDLSTLRSDINLAIATIRTIITVFAYLATLDEKVSTYTRSTCMKAIQGWLFPEEQVS